jgi:hypothetical protein
MRHQNALHFEIMVRKWFSHAWILDLLDSRMQSRYVLGPWYFERKTPAWMQRGIEQVEAESIKKKPRNC